jgi:hypothetical protein
MISIHYAYQMCDNFSFQKSKRFCGDDRTLLSKKSFVSFLESVKNCNNNNKNIQHVIQVIYDRCSDNLLTFLHEKISEYNSNNIQINIESLYPEEGISKSIKKCYEWMSKEGKDFVFQIQDDYLFSQNAIFNSLDMFFQIYNDTKIEPIIQPFNDVSYWFYDYKNKTTPRTIFLGREDYWIQIYDTSCSFLTSKNQFIKHWDLYKTFFKLIDKFDSTQTRENIDLENKSLNYMFTKRAVLGVSPIKTLSLHIQNQPDPYVDWKTIWDNTKIE